MLAESSCRKLLDVSKVLAFFKSFLENLCVVEHQTTKVTEENCQKMFVIYYIGTGRF